MSPETIIAATDFSSAANNAVEYALKIAPLLKARVILVNAYTGSSLNYEAVYDDIILTVNETALEKLETIKKIMCAKHNCDFDIECMAERGVPAEVINIAVKKYNAVLIVTGVKDWAGTLNEFFSEGTSIKIARNQETPTLLIPEGVKYKPIKKIGFACDMNCFGKTEMIYNVRHFSRIFDAELEVIKVKSGDEEPTIEKLYTNLFIEKKFQNIKHTIVELSGPDVAFELEDYFNSHPVDIILLSPKKHNLLYYLFNDSITKELAFHTRQPILAIH